MIPLQREGLFLRLLFNECKVGRGFAVVFLDVVQVALCYITHVQGKLYSFVKLFYFEIVVTF